jgi:hypothetical protein
VKRPKHAKARRRLISRTNALSSAPRSIVQRQADQVLPVSCWPFAATSRARLRPCPGATAAISRISGIAACRVPPDARSIRGGRRRLDPASSLYQPEDLAETILRLVRRPRDEVTVGWPARAGQLSYATAPGLTEALVGSASLPTSVRVLLHANPEGRHRSNVSGICHVLLHPIGLLPPRFGLVSPGRAGLHRRRWQAPVAQLDRAPDYGSGG